MPSRNLRGQIDNFRARIENSDDISDADAEYLIEFSDRMDLLQSQIGCTGKSFARLQKEHKL